MNGQDPRTSSVHVLRSTSNARVSVFSDCRRALGLKRLVLKNLLENESGVTFSCTLSLSLNTTFPTSLTAVACRPVANHKNHWKRISAVHPWKIHTRAVPLLPPPPPRRSDSSASSMNPSFPTPTPSNLTRPISSGRRPLPISPTRQLPNPPPISPATPSALKSSASPPPSPAIAPPSSRGSPL